MNKLRQPDEVPSSQKPGFSRLPTRHDAPGMLSIWREENNFSGSTMMTNCSRSRPIALDVFRFPPFADVGYRLQGFGLEFCDFKYPFDMQANEEIASLVGQIDNEDSGILRGWSGWQAQLHPEIDNGHRCAANIDDA